MSGEMPDVGDRVTILRGRWTAHEATVGAIDNAAESPLYVVGDNLGFAVRLRPDEVEILPKLVKFVVSETTPGPSTATLEQAQKAGLQRGDSFSYNPGTESTIQPGTLRQIHGRKIASAKTIDENTPDAWRNAVAGHQTYLGYTAWIDAIENGEPTL